jgi:hypothetical protein
MSTTEIGISRCQASSNIPKHNELEELIVDIRVVL